MSAAEMRREARLFDRHVVRMGETAFSIARGYAISPLILAEDNPGTDITRIKAGQVLLIRKRERGKTDPDEVASQWRVLTEETTAAPDAAEAAQDEDRDGGSQPEEPANTPEERYRQWIESGRGVAGGGHTVPGLHSGRAVGYVPDSNDPPRIAMMLPLSGTDENPAGNDFTDFYKGALLALEDLRAEGHSATVTLYDSENSFEKTRRIVTSAEFMDTDLVIGPVFEGETEPVMQFGEFFGIPVVSPLATLYRLDSEVLFQMAPDAGSKYDKLRPLLEGDVNIIAVSSGAAADDGVFKREIEAELAKLGRNYGRFTIGDEGGIAALIDWRRPNVLIVLAGNEFTVNQALTAISSSYNEASATSSRRASIAVVGNSRWANFDGISIDLNLMFKLNVRFVTSYYINRADPKTKLLEARYLKTYGDFPSRSALRGYDAVALFAGALFESGSSFTDRLERMGSTPLNTSYRFVRAGDGERPRIRVNDQWTLVSFSSDYRITTQ